MAIETQMIADFRDWYDGFPANNYTDSQVRKALLKADYQTGSSRWGGYKYTNEHVSYKAQGLFAYAAHIMSINSAAAKTSAAGSGSIATGITQMTSKTVASESVSFADSSSKSSNGNSSASDPFLNSTVYGQEFILLRNAAMQGGMMV